MPVNYLTWLSEFTKGKAKLSNAKDPNPPGVHSVLNFVDEKRTPWQVAQTYTGRVVVRSGTVESEGTKVKWSEWETLHNVSIP